ncbi:Maf family protein [bacterium]|nr:Maf family protein [bacterium]
MFPLLYLASNSPRRSSILTKFGLDHRIILHSFDENSLIFEQSPSSRAFVRELSKQKALSINTPYSSWILTADTCVVFQDRLLGKPSSLNEACHFLDTLQGHTHVVLTAFCLYHQQQQRLIQHVRSSQVTFNSLTRTQIEHYVYSKKPLDKAGAYGIQECPLFFIKKYTGSKYTIIGLPIYTVLAAIKRIQSDSHSL